jgi:hypothetical protein
MVTAVVASRLFCALSVLLPVLPLALLLVSSALRSSPLSRGLFTTTAYADSLPALTGKVSPGKAPELSPRAVGLYPPRSFDNLWTSPSLAGSSPVAGLSARSCFYGRGFAFRFFQLCLAATPCGLATVAVIGPGDLLSCHKFRPMLGTLARHGVARFAAHIRRPRLILRRKRPGCKPVCVAASLCDALNLKEASRATRRLHRALNSELF